MGRGETKHGPPRGPRCSPVWNTARWLPWAALVPGYLGAWEGKGGSERTASRVDDPVGVLAGRVPHAAVGGGRLRRWSRRPAYSSRRRGRGPVPCRGWPRRPPADGPELP